MKTWNERQHEVWELRHSVCVKCHPNTPADKKKPCICGPEPCKRCGNTRHDITATGCDWCDRLHGDGGHAKSIDIELCSYVIWVRCPYCDKGQGVEGHDGGFHPIADALECCKCGKKAWLGVDKHGDFDSVEDDAVYLEKGEA